MCFAPASCRFGSSANTWWMRHWSKPSRCGNRHKTKLICEARLCGDGALPRPSGAEPRFHRSEFVNPLLVACGKNVQDLLQFMPQVRHAHGMMHRKRQGRLVPLGLGLHAQLHPRTRDGEPIFIKQLLDLHYRLHVALAVHALPGAAFYGLELRKFGFPEAKYVGRQAAQAGNFADAEIELVRNDDFGVAGFLRSFLSEAHVRRAHGAASVLLYTSF